MSGFSFESPGLALEDGSSLQMEERIPNILLESGEYLLLNDGALMELEGT